MSAITYTQEMKRSMLSVRIDEELIKNLKQRAQDTGRSVQSLVEEALDDEYGEIHIDYQRVQQMLEDESRVTPKELARQEKFRQDFNSGRILAFPEGIPSEEYPVPTGKDLDELKERVRNAFANTSIAETISNEREEHERNLQRNINRKIIWENMPDEDEDEERST